MKHPGRILKAPVVVKQMLLIYAFSNISAPIKRGSSIFASREVIAEMLDNSALPVSK